MTWQLRATEGPLKGAVYRLRKRTSLGRAGDCDVQIIHDGVSRRHAKVVGDGDGHELVDLGSNNGTFVKDARIQRVRLSEGDEIRIMRSRFVYEAAAGEEAEPGSGRDVWAVKITDGSTLRQTVDHVVAPDRPTPPRGETMEDLEVRRSGRAVARVFEPKRHRITALRPDGSRYKGDLVSDILVFRDLQLRVTRHETVSPIELEVLQRFASAFGQPADDPSPYASLRRFVRFRCRFPARVRWVMGSEERTAAVDVQDLGVGGARLMWQEHPLHEGVVAWLVIDTVASVRTRTLVFPTRVAWATPSEIGLQFAGMPEWERGPS